MIKNNQKIYSVFQSSREICLIGNLNWCVSASACLQYMMTGSSLIKVRPNSRQYHRFFTLAEDLNAIRWTPTSKKTSKAIGKNMAEVLVFKVHDNTRLYKPALCTPIQSVKLSQTNKTGARYRLQITRWSPWGGRRVWCCTGDCCLRGGGLMDCFWSEQQTALLVYKTEDIKHVEQLVVNDLGWIVATRHPPRNLGHAQLLHS
jgi:hypothetical protein